MPLGVVVVVAIVAAGVGGAFVAVLAEYSYRYLDQENRMLRKLLADQAELQKMSMDTYVAMLQIARRHVGG